MSELINMTEQLTNNSSKLLKDLTDLIKKYEDDILTYKAEAMDYQKRFNHVRNLYSVKRELIKQELLAECSNEIGHVLKDYELKKLELAKVEHDLEYRCNDFMYYMKKEKKLDEKERELISKEELLNIRENELISKEKELNKNLV